MEVDCVPLQGQIQNEIATSSTRSRFRLYSSNAQNQSDVVSIYTIAETNQDVISNDWPKPIAISITTFGNSISIANVNEELFPRKDHDPLPIRLS